ncbi:MAG TPA: glycosyltransferase family 39 protein [Candidatus Binatia bacterium]
MPKRTANKPDRKPVTKPAEIAPSQLRFQTVTNRFRRSELAVLLLLWIFATALNLTKAYHIDDTAHLEIAQWIIREPWRPMSGQINWSENTEPIYVLNQPHLYFYLLAGWGALWGFGEVPMHLLQSFFTLACILLTYGIAKIIAPSGALLTTALLMLSPAFVVGQNLMLDVPLLSVWLAFFYVLIAPQFKSETRRFVLTGFLVGCACLIKYSSLPLALLMLLYLIVKRQFRLLWTVSIPAMMLVLWSCWNYLDYGSVHMMGRRPVPFSWNELMQMSVSWLICLGAILPYSLIYFRRNSELRAKTFSSSVKWLVVVLTAMVFAAVHLHKLDVSGTEKVFLLLFFTNGIAIVLTLLSCFLQGWLQTRSQQQQAVLLLYLWVAAGASFTILYAPFMATRHVLVVIVPITLLLARFVDPPSLAWRSAMLLLTASLSLVLGVSDWTWANFYREKAVAIRRELPATANVYFTGHWGWQWYAKQNGMKQLEALNPQLKIGDYLVYPLAMDNQTLKNVPADRQLTVQKIYTAPFSLLTFFSTRDRVRFYASDTETAPWMISFNAIPPIVVFQVTPKQ